MSKQEAIISLPRRKRLLLSKLSKELSKYKGNGKNGNGRNGNGKNGNGRNGNGNGKREILKKLRDLPSESLDDPTPYCVSSSILQQIYMEKELLNKPEETLLQIDRKETVNKLLRKLDTRMRRIISLRFGLDGNGCRTLREVSRQIGLSRERVRQLEDEALNLLKINVEETDSKELINV